MRRIDLPLEGACLLEPNLHADGRGFFFEAWNQRTLNSLGVDTGFVQENHSRSARGVLRGLHYQLGKPQGKLVRVLSGHIWDVAVDLRRDSPDFGRHAAFDLKPRNADGELEMLWIPEGFAHGFLVLSEAAVVLYKTTDGYYPEGERCIRWNDPTLGIAWPLDTVAPAVSAKDALGCDFAAAELP